MARLPKKTPPAAMCVHTKGTRVPFVPISPIIRVVGVLVGHTPGTPTIGIIVNLTPVPVVGVTDGTLGNH